MRGVVAMAAVLACLTATPSAAPQQSADKAPPKRPAAQTPSQTSSKKPSADAASPAFATLLRRATEARMAGRWEEAVTLYRRVVAAKPSDAEGYWYLGTASYTLERFTDCRDAFAKLVRLAPKNGAAHAFLGLCEFGTGEYGQSLIHLLQSRELGVGDTGDLGGTARYHAASLMIKAEQFEQALETLGEFAGEANDSPRVIQAMGLATLRLAWLPDEIEPERREMVMMAGRASYMMATRNTATAEKAFQALVARYPDTPNVHYANGVFLLQEQPDKGIEEFKRELELQPEHAWSLMQIAYEYVNRGDSATGLPWAKRAVAAAPEAFAARKALGQALLETGDVDGAIVELLIGVKLAPASPGLHFTLARAYQRAGRLDDAARERAEFTRLDRLARTQRSGAQSVGGR